MQEDRRLMAASVFFGLVFTALGLVPPWMVGEMVRGLQQSAPPRLFVQLGLLTAVVFVARGVSRYLYGLCSHVAAYHTLHRLLGEVCDHLHRMSPSFRNERHSGNLVARSVGDVEQIEDFIAHGIPETLLAVVIPLAMGTVLFLLNWQLALIALTPLPVVAVLSYVVRRKTGRLWSAVRHQFARLSGRMQDHLAGLSTIQSFTAESSSSALLRAESRRYRDDIIRANRWSLLPAALVESARGAGLVLLIFAGCWLTGPAPLLQVEVADLVVFVLYLGQIFLPFLRLANLSEQLEKSAASARRVVELLETPPLITDAPHAAVPAQFEPRVEFQGVTFAYRDGQPVLRDLSFQIAEGETVALVGATGAGKTTVCHLLLRFFDVNSGCIRVGGSDIRCLPLAFLRRQIALVPQDVFLFDGTLRDNLLLGNPQASDAELSAAAQAAHCLEFIEQFPRRWETRVGERGVRLSGGQKQRVALARALLKDAPLLVLDEATSAVDAETETLIRDAVARLTRNRTVLIVAHRHSTIQAADRILVLEEGRIVETGNYDELLQREGVFTRLCQLQENALW